MTSARGFYRAIKSSMPFEDELVSRALSRASRNRVLALSGDIEQYLIENLPKMITSKKKLADYRINPYVTMTTASTMKLTDPRDLANFLVNLKLYMSLETSFGKSLESEIMGHYPAVGPPVERASRSGRGKQVVEWYEQRGKGYRPHPLSLAGD